MKQEIVELNEDIRESALYSEDLAPVPASGRTWSMWNLAFLWVGMAVCIPTYMLASYMIKSGLSWWGALLIIGLANIVITVPMALNGHGGVKYGIPFPVLGRAAFGTRGIHIPAFMRAIVACGWFGIQTWIGGLALYAIFNASFGLEGSTGLDIGKFIAFGLFWFLNMYFVWKGTESIKWLEEWSAPILVIMGILLIVWGASRAGGFGVVLDQSKQLEHQTAVIEKGDSGLVLNIFPLQEKEGTIKADEYRIRYSEEEDARWSFLEPHHLSLPLEGVSQEFKEGIAPLLLTFREGDGSGGYMVSTELAIRYQPNGAPASDAGIWSYILWFSAMVGFWATMSISISDITRYTHSQKSQVAGQFIGLPGTMILYSFVGIFVTCAAVINFKDVLISEDAPWDPVSLLSKFDSPLVVIIAQIFMIIATLSTNIAANVIAPANAFANMFPRSLSFRGGGTITGIVGILICPWWLMNDISAILIFVSGLLGPVLAILIADYFVIRKTRLDLPGLFNPVGPYAFSGGFHIPALIALVVGIFTAVIGLWVPQLEFLYNLSWFSGFIVAFVVYAVLAKRPQSSAA